MEGKKRLSPRAIGKLDRAISKIVLASKEHYRMDKADCQTLKHHAEDMLAAGQAILLRLKGE